MPDDPLDFEIDTAAILATIRDREGGSYTSRPSGGGTASGAYQFTDATWLAAGGGQYAPHAYQATREQQDQVAAAYVNRILQANASRPKWERLEALAQTWYIGHPASASELDKVPGTGNRLTVREYTDKWLQTYFAKIGDSTLFGKIIGGAKDVAGAVVDPVASAVLGALGALVDPFVKGLKRLSIIGLATGLGVVLVGMGAYKSVQAKGARG
jgi:hypothetical protein